MERIHMLGEFLVRNKVISTRQLLNALEFQKSTMRFLSMMSIMERNLARENLDLISQKQLELGVSFEVAATELGFISAGELSEISITNKSFRIPLGEILVRQNSIKQETVDYWVGKFENQELDNQKLISLLSSVPLFSKLSEDKLIGIAECFKFKYFSAGEVIYNDGDANNGIFLIDSGLIRLSVVNDDEVHELGSLQSGDHFGMEGTLENSPRQGKAEAVMNSNLWRMDPASFKKLVSGNSQVAAAAVEYLSSHLKSVFHGIQGKRPAFQTNIYTIVIDQKSENARGMAGEIVNKLYEEMRGNTQILFTPDGLDLPEYSDTKEFASRPGLGDRRNKGEFFCLYSPGIVNSKDIQRLLKWLHQESKHLDRLVIIVDVNSEEFIELLLQNSIRTAIILEENFGSLLGHVTPGRDRVYITDSGDLRKNATRLLNRLPETSRPFAPQAIRGRNREQAASMIVRWLSGKTLGVSFGGGGARGIAHTGILEEFEREGIIIDEVAGASVGSIVAGAYANGLSAKEIQEFFIRRAIEAKKHPFLDFGIPLRSLARGKRLTRLLQEVYGDSYCYETRIPFFAITTDMARGQEYIPRDCELVRAVKASSTLPGILPVMNVENRRLGDGGIVNNIPSQILKEYGSSIVISLNITGDPSKSEFNHRSMAGALSRTIDIMVNRSIDRHYKYTDIEIKPDVDGFGTADFSVGHKHMDLGRRAARQKMPEIKRLIAKVDEMS